MYTVDISNYFSNTGLPSDYTTKSRSSRHTDLGTHHPSDHRHNVHASQESHPPLLSQTPRQPCRLPGRTKRREKKNAATANQENALLNGTVETQDVSVFDNPAQEKKYLLPLSLVTSKFPFLGISGNVSGSHRASFGDLLAISFFLAALFSSVTK